MFETINPLNNQSIQQFPVLKPDALRERLELAGHTFSGYWREQTIAQRAIAVHRLADLLRAQKDHLAGLITLEMGKLTGQSVGEIEKCAWLCDYMADQAATFLADRPVETDHAESFINYQPLGAVLGIMPWNFPFWQVFRYAVPAVLAGNVILLKPAPNVPQCGLAIESLFAEATGKQGVFQTLLVEVEQAPEIIAHPIVQGVTVTGSDWAGAAVAAEAGKHLKKCVMELGGSDPFIVLDDADLEAAAAAGLQSRLNNCGQTCIAAKRFIVQESVFPKYRDLLIDRLRELKIGAPDDPNADLSVMARPDLVRNLERQVRESIDKGAHELLAGGPESGPGNFFRPVVLTDVRPGMPAYEEELFGPVISLFSVPDEAAAVKLANDSRYGLGAAVWTRDPDRAKGLARRLQAGAVAVNDIVKSDPRLPFGGVKRSGFGRELGPEGIREFVNVQSIVLNKE